MKIKTATGWKGIVIVFTVLIFLILMNFAWQVQRINKSFHNHSLNQSSILGAVVELNIRNAMESREKMEAITAKTLENSARFVNYLNQLTSFAPRELAAFAKKSGLAGITIDTGNSASPVTGPSGWMKQPPSKFDPGLTYLPSAHLYVYLLSPAAISSQSTTRPTVMVGMSSARVEEVCRTLSVQHLLSLLNQMQGIEYVRFEETVSASQPNPLPTTRLVHSEEALVSETLIAMGDNTLVVGLKADYFSGRITALKKELMGFIFFLVILGIMAGWWLYTLQQQQLEQTRQFERKMARQMEQASLGRAAATITHEMRNPLNAISMGLQRLHIEADSLEQSHYDLISSMRQAVERSNAVISRLQQYVQPFSPEKTLVKVDHLIHSLAVLYHPQCCENNILLNLNMTQDTVVTGDVQYLSQSFENLLKNAVEAQPRGGHIDISSSIHKKELTIQIENPASELSPEKAHKLVYPYFTTKTHGTGLGLVISKKIVEGHGGKFSTAAKQGKFRVTVQLPLSTETGFSTPKKREDLDGTGTLAKPLPSEENQT